MANHFTNHREAALALLNSGCRLTRSAGQFLGQCAVDCSELTEKQANWLGKLLDKHGLPPLRREAGQ